MTTQEKKSKFMRPAILVALLLAAGLLMAASFRLDDPVRDYVVTSQGKTWKKSSAAQLQGAISRYGDWPFLMVGGAVGLLVAGRFRNREWQRILITAMVASTVAGMLVNAVRLTTGRPRPRESPKIAQGWYGPAHEGKWIIGDSRYNSFPSGHTATAVGFAGVLFFARPLLGSAAMLIAFGIAWSRILLGAHHPSDIVVATILSLWIAWIAWRIARRRGDAIAAWARGKLRREP